MIHHWYFDKIETVCFFGDMTGVVMVFVRTILSSDWYLPIFVYFYYLGCLVSVVLGTCLVVVGIMSVIRLFDEVGDRWLWFRDVKGIFQCEVFLMCWIFIGCLRWWHGVCQRRLKSRKGGKRVTEGKGKIGDSLKLSRGDSPACLSQVMGC